MCMARRRGERHLSCAPKGWVGWRAHGPQFTFNRKVLLGLFEALALDGVAERLLLEPTGIHGIRPAAVNAGGYSSAKDVDRRVGHREDLLWLAGD